MTKSTTCPLCGKPSQPPSAPFCSQGCRDRDLLNWLGEAYRVPAQDNGEEAETGLDTTRDPGI